MIFFLLKDDMSGHHDCDARFRLCNGLLIFSAGRSMFLQEYMPDASLCKPNQEVKWDKNQKNKKFIQEMQAKIVLEAIK